MSVVTAQDWAITLEIMFVICLTVLFIRIVSLAAANLQSRRRSAVHGRPQRGAHRGEQETRSGVRGRDAGGPGLQMPPGGEPSMVGGSGGPVPVPAYGADQCRDSERPTGERIPVPASWRRGPSTTFRGGRVGLWLHVNHAGELAYTNRDDVERLPGQRDVSVFVFPVRPGQLVRVVDGRTPDDGLGHAPTIRADRAAVRASAPDTAVTVEVVPGPEAVRRAFKRPAEEAAFWNAMIAEPEDDLPTHVYADWLYERRDTAAGILRGSVPLLLHTWVGVGGRWERRNEMGVRWRQLLTRLAAPETGPGYRHFEWQPGNAGPLLARFPYRPPGEPLDPADEWHGLGVTIESGDPLSPVLNYLLIQLAMALSLPAEARAFMRRAREDGEKRRGATDGD
jgi:uncharacterized protein (TIGR02996 family)